MARKKVSKGKKKNSGSKKSSMKKSTKKVIKKSRKKSSKKTSSKSSRTKKVLSTPRGYNTITPYLVVKNAASAIEFYKKVFDAKEVMRMAQDGKIMHAELKFGDTKIMLADECPEMNAHAPEAYGGSPVGIHLYIKNVDGVVARALHGGAKLIRHVENMFYGDRIGTIQDPYGHKWSIATHIEDVSPAETKRRAAAMFSKKS